MNGPLTVLEATAASIEIEEARERQIARPLSDWTEEDGDVLWWFFPMTEAPYVGSPLCLGQTVEVHTHRGLASRFMVGGWPGYHTHWTRLPPLPKNPESAS